MHGYNQQCVCVEGWPSEGGKTVDLCKPREGPQRNPPLETPGFSTYQVCTVVWACSLRVHRCLFLHVYLPSVSMYHPCSCRFISRCSISRYIWTALKLMTVRPVTNEAQHFLWYILFCLLFSHSQGVKGCHIISLMQSGHETSAQRRPDVAGLSRFPLGKPPPRRFNAVRPHGGVGTTALASHSRGSEWQHGNISWLFPTKDTVTGLRSPEKRGRLTLLGLPRPAFYAPSLKCWFRLASSLMK